MSRQQKHQVPKEFTGQLVQNSRLAGGFFVSRVLEGALSASFLLYLSENHRCSLPNA